MTAIATDHELTDADLSAQLAGTSTRALLRAMHALTHDMHRTSQFLMTPGEADRLRDLRAQRDAVEAEVLRRTGDL